MITMGQEPPNHRATVLWRLYRRKMWGGKHMPFDLAAKNNDQRAALDQLIRDGLVVQQRKTGDRHVTLNINMKAAIEEEIGALMVQEP